MGELTYPANLFAGIVFPSQPATQADTSARAYVEAIRYRTSDPWGTAAVPAHATSATGASLLQTIKRFSLARLSRDQIAKRFSQLAAQWREETRFESALDQIVLNPAYL